jgi:16S rRNA G1207 methylase RsmC
MTHPAEVSRWQVAAPVLNTTPDVGSVILTASEPLREAADPSRVLFHEAMENACPRAPMVEIWLPAYRSRSLVSMLAWLAGERLALSDAEVTWWLEKRQGPETIARVLGDLGWRNVVHTREGRLHRLDGQPPPHVSMPEPKSFAGRIGARELEFDADYGVFSPTRIDAGSELLAEVALTLAPANRLADIGIGYGALAVGLIANGAASAAAGTDIDSVALWLARRNAERYGVDLAVACTPDPLQVPPTPLTVCNMPTHIDASSSRALMAGLIRRAVHGPLLMVVHQSLEQRYSRQLTDAGLFVSRHTGPAHTVLHARCAKARDNA